MVLAGQRLVVWGGWGASGPLGDGAVYDVQNDTWTPMSSDSAPAPRQRHTAVWTGSEVLFWGGQDPFYADGGAYDPVANTWRPIPASPTVVARGGHFAVWTGSEMIVWGGFTTTGGTLTGGRYANSTGTWVPTSTTGGPDPLYGDAEAVLWAGNVMIVTGGYYDEFVWEPWHGGYRDRRYRPNSHLYDPVTDTWQTLSGSLSWGEGFSAVWTGSEAIFWGGAGCYDYYETILFEYVWYCATSGGPGNRWLHKALWAGSRMLIWGGWTTWDGLPPLGFPTGDGALDPGYSTSPDVDADGSTVCGGDCNDLDAATYPLAAQVCGDGLNNDCLHPSWPSLAGTNETDDDGDGFSECQNDCTDADASAWLTPSEATMLELTHDVASTQTSLSWLAAAQPGASTVYYDLLRTRNKNNFTTLTACAESNDSSDTTAVDFASPPAGAGFFYLVRSENGCPGGARAGSDSAGAPIPAKSCP